MDRWTAAPWGRGLVTLVGDAAHPMTPNLGQGGCTALEDAVLLADAAAPFLLRLSPADPTRLRLLADSLRRFEGGRAQRCLPLTVSPFLVFRGRLSRMHPSAASSSSLTLSLSLFLAGPLQPHGSGASV